MKRLQLTITLSGILSIFCSTYLFAQVNIDESVLYSIESLSSGKTISASGHSHIVISKKDNSHVLSNWEFQDMGNGFGKLVNTANGYVLSYDPNGIKLGFLYLAEYRDGDSQLWKLKKHSEKEVSIISKLNGWALDIMDNKTKQGSFVIAYPYHGEPNQRWILTKNRTGDMNFTSVSAGLLLAATPLKGGNGSVATQWVDRDALWKIESAEDGYYYVRRPNKDLVLQTSNQKVNSEIAIELWQFEGSDRQKWYFKQYAPEVYEIYDFDEARCLDLILENSTDGAPIITYKPNEGINQRWKLVAYEN